MSVRPTAGPDRGPLRTAPGLRAEPLCPPNPLWASNGIVAGPDGRLWIAQFLGGTVSAFDPATGGLETVLGPDGPLTAPDDLVLGDGGELFVVDLPAGLVWRRAPDGAMTVVADGITAPDGIAWHRGRLFVNELCPDGRLLEIDPTGGPPRVLATGLALGNAMEVGPDGLLYYPHLLSGEVWRVDPDGGTPERLLAGLDRPVAVRFDTAGRLRILSNGGRGSLGTAEGGRITATLDTGVGGADNVVFTPDGSAWVTGAFHGGLVRVGPDGTATTVLPPGLCGPWGVTADGVDALVADHFSLARVGGGTVTVLGDVVTEVRGGVRGIARHRDGTVVTTGTGVWHGRPGAWTPLAEGLAGASGVATVPDGVLVAETGAGRVLHLTGEGAVSVLASGLDGPVDVAVDEAGTVYATLTGGGQVVRLTRGTDGGTDPGTGTVLAAGLHRPEGLAVAGGVLWCAETAAGRLLRIDPRTRSVGVAVAGPAFDVRPPHVPADCRGGAATRPAPFAGVAADGDGSVLVAVNGEGYVLRVRP
ncbi:hypothetical protein [Pseudonocardia sp. ICBG1293]|uniref:Vgb family protein n=1 Tax=Pseudonocardia sp. ICBG1293 TaxID=2844382 RepID=UPI001CCB0D32|nr:hypothetical protein [Pseudonocardia sp. ICBG1293]